MPTAWNVHTGLAVNGSAYLAEVPPVVDRENMIATVALPVLYRGTRQAFLNAFKFGAQNCPQGGTGMFCLGPQDVRMVPYSSADPHWTGTVTWMGVHSEVTGSSTYAFAVLPEWTTRETSFPISFTPAGGGTETHINYGPPFTPNGEGPAGPWKGRRIDYLPTRQVTGVIFSSAEPTPAHPSMTALVLTFPTPSSSLLTNYGPLLPDPTFVTGPGQSAPATNSPLSATGKWMARNFKINRRIAKANAGYAEPALWHITATYSYEQLRQPS